MTDPHVLTLGDFGRWGREHRDVLEPIRHLLELQENGDLVGDISTVAGKTSRVSWVFSIVEREQGDG